jgi:broad specificity phosphatase PhoE
MTVRIIVLRHGERMDRYVEAQGKDWLSSAPRPQDPSLSKFGEQQIVQVGGLIKKCLVPGTVKILSSPLVRCVQTSTILAQEIGFSSKIVVEEGLMEDAKSMRGREEGEKKPVWTPTLILRPNMLQEFSPILDAAAESFVKVQHVKDEEVLYNQVREIHQHDPSITDVNEVTLARVQLLIKELTTFLKTKKGIANLCLVSHGAVVKLLASEMGAVFSKKCAVAGWAAFDLDVERAENQGWGQGAATPVFDNWQEADIKGNEDAMDSRAI